MAAASFKKAMFRPETPVSGGAEGAPMDKRMEMPQQLMLISRELFHPNHDE